MMVMKCYPKVILCGGSNKESNIDICLQTRVINTLVCHPQHEFGKTS